MNQEEMERYIKSATKGSRSGGGFVTREMEERGNTLLGTLMDKTKDNGRRIIVGASPTHILRRKV